MADMLLCTRFDVSDLLLDTFKVCTGQDNHYLIEVESIGLTPVFQLIVLFNFILTLSLSLSLALALAISLSLCVCVCVCVIRLCLVTIFENFIEQNCKIYRRLTMLSTHMYLFLGFNCCRHKSQFYQIP